jgi:phosphonate degradation associated HDIG domain protein
MALTINDIENIFAQRGHEQYVGEPVTMLEHALQSAHLAESDGADDELITAALLHDLGHLLHEMMGTPSAQGIDDVHQFRVVPFFRGLFPETVINAVQWHVDAKRYLCAIEPAYYDALSVDSKRSLQLQGGIYTPTQALAFIRQSGASDAVRLRRWDDRAKHPGRSTPDLAHFLQHVRRCALNH